MYYINRRVGDSTNHSPRRIYLRTSLEREILLFSIFAYYFAILFGRYSVVNTAINASRALSLRNLVSGYECGRVFPAGVGLGSPSRDTANWLPPRFSLSVETRRR